MSMTQPVETKKGARIFALIFAVALISRIHIATGVKTCLDGDESMAGVMAYRIQDRGEHPIYPYGHEYGGGVSVEAYSAAALNSAFGRSALNVQLPAILAFSVLVAVAALLALQASGTFAAVFAGLHIVFAPQLFRSSVQAYGYMEALAASSACFYVIMLSIADEDDQRKIGRLSKRVLSGALVGLLSGFAYWCVEFSAVMTVWLFLIYAACRKKESIPFLAAWAVLFPVGAAPTVYYNFTNNFQNLRHLIGGHGVGTHRADRPVYEFFTRELPSFFQNDNTDYFAQTIPITAWLLLGAVLLGCGIAFYYAARGGHKSEKGRKIVIFGLLFCVLYSITYIVSPFRGESARYFLPLEPFITVGMAVGVSALFGSRKAVAVVVAVAIIAIVVFADFKGTAFAYRDNTVSDGSGRVACYELDALIHALKGEGITHVFTNRFLKWMLLFRTEEQINAADVNLVPAALAWTEYEDAVSASPDPVFVFDRRDNHVDWLKFYMRFHHIGYSVAETGMYTIIRPSVRVSQFEFMNWSKAAFVSLSSMRKSTGKK